MLQYPHIDPILLKLGPLQIHWYGVMYLLGFLAAYLLGRMRAHRVDSVLKPDMVSDLIFYGALGVVLGGRIGYVLFYQWSALRHDPLMVFRIWQGGMSFHGGLLGVMLAMVVFARSRRVPWWAVMDFVAPLVPIGLAAGRLGNFINGELWGRVSHVPWAMVFPSGGPWARHPSQLYEFMTEGVLLFVLLWWYSSKPRPVPSVSALFLVLYGAMRFVLEFFRAPDPQLGLVAFDRFSMGQVLSLPMLCFGVVIFIVSYRRKTI